MAGKSELAVKYKRHKMNELNPFKSTIDSIKIEGKNIGIKGNFGIPIFKYLNKINLLIGKNNSGKSRIVREIINPRRVNKFYKEAPLDFLLNTLEELKHSFDINSHTLTIKKINFKKERDNLEKFQATATGDLIETIEYYKTILPEQLKAKTTKNNHVYIDKFIESSLGRINNTVTRLENEFTNKHLKYLYIPILRGLRPINSGKTTITEGDSVSFNNIDVYEARTINDYFNNSNSINIFSGLTLYEDIKQLLLGDEKGRSKIREFEDLLSKELFDGNKVTLIPKHNEDVLNVKIGNDPQLPIYKLGDGIQSIITILFPIFINSEDDFITVIEEPEIHLHQSMQVLLLECLKRFENHTFFISTHSSAFINDDSTSIYQVNKSKDSSKFFHITIDNQKREALNELGFKPSDLLQSNYILWVEGPSDKIYLNYWIKEIDESLEENLHYSIMYFGGDNYNEFLNSESGFDTLNSMNRSNGIIFDSDKIDESSKIDEKKLNLKIQFEEEDKFVWITNKREIENYIDLELFKNSINEIHQIDSTDIQEGEYVNRCKPINPKMELSYKSTIKLNSEIFDVVKKNDGDFSKIKAKNLKDSLKKSIKKTANKSFRINKVSVAKKVVSLKPKIVDQELKDQIIKLVNKIKEAN